MGLLDDAIREHLELKRLRGADPGVVAREEHDALGALPRRGNSEHDREKEGGADVPPQDDELAIRDMPTAPVTAGQETVEINMEAELAGETDSEQAREVDRAERPGAVAHPHGRAISEESLEWEVPTEDAAMGDQAGVSKFGDLEEDSSDHGTSDAAEPVEDVLEETPDFLRDTPEQERLWFEQRPPRDFDFNE
jgi:hypothetical protein